MPRIDPQLLDTTFYLYPTRQAAESGVGFGGTGFLLSVRFPIEGRPEGGISFYGVTNWHVAVKNGHSVARLRRKDGTTRIVETDPADWFFIPSGNDIAVIPLALDFQNDRFAHLNVDLMSVRENEDIGVGEDVFMLGRFIDFDGGERNSPAARFGQISMLPEKIKTEHGDRLSFCIDMHSRAGYSGSPVFLYRTPGSDLTKCEIYPPLVRFLGIHWAQFPELWEISEKNAIVGDASLVAEGKYVKGLSGMTCVAPAWDIVKTLYLPELKSQREAAAKRLAETTKEKPLPPMEESAEEAET